MNTIKLLMTFNDIIEKVDVKKDNPSVGKVHYLTHRPVGDQL